MKKIVKGVEPPKLLAYRQRFPMNNWKQFRKNNNTNQRYTEVKSQLIVDQGGLCAYCEIDLKQAIQPGELDDFRVEHFHPKSDSTSGYNWNLDWNNLLGCCHGGSNSHVPDAVSVNGAGRYTSNRPDRSCDVPKDNHNWGHIIFNPLTLPSSPLLFAFQRSSGSIKVHTQNCMTAAVDQQKIQDSIDYLNLDSLRLQRLRRKALGTLNDNLQKKAEVSKSNSNILVENYFFLVKLRNFKGSCFSLCFILSTAHHCLLPSKLLS